MSEQRQLKVSVNANVTLTYTHIRHVYSYIQKFKSFEFLNYNDSDLKALLNDFDIEFQPNLSRMTIKGYNPRYLVQYCTDKSRFKTITQALESLGISRMLYSLIKRGERSLNDNICNKHDILPWD